MKGYIVTKKKEYWPVSQFPCAVWFERVRAERVAKNLGEGWEVREVKLQGEAK